MVLPGHNDPGAHRSVPVVRSFVGLPDKVYIMGQLFSSGTNVRVTNVRVTEVLQINVCVQHRDVKKEKRKKRCLKFAPKCPLESNTE